MFVNEPDRYRTIDHERDIELTMVSSDRDGNTKFMLRMGDKQIPFEAYATFEETDENTPTNRTWHVFLFGRIVVGMEEKCYEFVDENEKNQVRKIIVEALTTFGMLFGRFNTRVVAVKF